MCNTKALSTSGNGLRTLVDWVQVTFKNEQDYKKILDILRMKEDDFIEVNGLYQYRKALYHDGIFILYDGNEEMGVHLQISGKGCRTYEGYNLHTWSELFGQFLWYDGKFTRIDLAIDDFHGYFSIPQVIRKIKRVEFVSKFKKAYRIEQINLENGQSEGNTVYFGSASSKLQIRMYEKNHERRNKGYKLEDGITCWNRTELQLRDERANVAAHLISADYFRNRGIIEETNEKTIEKYAAGILKNYLRFVVRNENDRNKHRWKTCKWWEEFTQGVERIKLSEKAPDRTVEQVINWLSKQTAISLAMVDLVEKGIIEKLIEEGRERFKDKHLKMVLEYADRKNPPQEKAEG